jgi:class 3 adenylate cyclase
MSTLTEQVVQLEQAIRTLEAQRVTLGDAVVDTASAALRRQLSELRQSDAIAPAPSLAEERKVVTVMFADLSGFTALSERMDPESSRNLINTCFARLVPIIEKYQGTVEKFIGDEIMAMFGAPVVHENDAERAVRTALEMMDAQIQFNVEQGTDLGMHIGINTGLTVAGGIGSPERQAYGVSGDAVNLASRLADASERGQIFIGPDTHRLVCSLVEVKALPSITIKGKRKPIPVYQVIGLKAVAGSVRGLERQGMAFPLVGRDVEMARLKSCIDRLHRGQGSIVAITGEAGLGKSRLVAEIRQIAGTDSKSGLHWLEGQTLSFGQTISYWPFQEILRTWAGITKDDDEQDAWNKLECHARATFAEETMDFLTVPCQSFGSGGEGRLC